MNIRLLSILFFIIVRFSSIASATTSDTIENKHNEIRPISFTYTIEWGKSDIIDTYLSPLKYSGDKFSLSAEWMKALKQNPQHLSMIFDAEIYGDICKSPARNSSLYNIGIDLGWHIFYKYQPIKGLTIGGGGGATINAGALYLPRNSNNPVSAYASIDATLNAIASYSLNIGKLPIRITNRTTLPSLGVFFSPDYGQTYYEIYLGNHSGLVHFGWWGNHFSLDNHLSASIAIGNMSLRLGYRFNIKSSYVNNINTRHTSHAITFGISSDWINQRSIKHPTTYNIISALY